MGRILFSTIGSLGDLHPLIGIGLELKRRGHDVGFCTSETYRPRLEALGFVFKPLRPDATPENEEAAHLVREIMDPRKGVERLLLGWIMPNLRSTYTDLLRAVHGPPAMDLLVAGELVYPAPLISEKLNLRWASCIMAPMSFFSPHDPPILPPVPNLSRILRGLGPVVNRLALRIVKLVTRRWGDPIRALRAELGLREGQDPIYEGKFSPFLVLALFSTVLAKPQADWPANTVATGFVWYDGAPERAVLPETLASFLKSGPPPIVFTLGSSAVLDPGNFYRESAAATERLKSRAVMLIGRNAPPSNLPREIVAFNYAGFSELFPRAATIVHQGGIGTTGQSLRGGCPVLVMPFNFDQADNAARVVRLGVGKTISRVAYKADHVASTLHSLLQTPDYSENAKRIAQSLQSENGAVTAANALEKLLR